MCVSMAGIEKKQPKFFAQASDYCFWDLLKARKSDWHLLMYTHKKWVTIWNKRVVEQRNRVRSTTYGSSEWKSVKTTEKERTGKKLYDEITFQQKKCCKKTAKAEQFPQRKLCKNIFLGVEKNREKMVHTPSTTSVFSTQKKQFLVLAWNWHRPKNSQRLNFASVRFFYRLFFPHTSSVETIIIKNITAFYGCHAIIIIFFSLSCCASCFPSQW